MTADRCLRWPMGAERLCQLPKGHAGTCLVVARFPVRDISDTNPEWRRTA